MDGKCTWCDVFLTNWNYQLHRFPFGLHNEWALLWLFGLDTLGSAWLAV
jgi:hypothetical protein